MNWKLWPFIPIGRIRTGVVILDGTIVMGDGLNVVQHNVLVYCMMIQSLIIVNVIGTMAVIVCVSKISQ